jgi:3-hydroxyisobutyrate dehydrogenase-like beta-hydroxyacid dehydrogenase
MGNVRGIEPDKAMDVILDSAFASPALAGKRPVILGQADNVAFDLAGARKDLAAALSAAASPGPIGLAALAKFDAALAEGWGARDVAAIAAYSNRRA